MLRISMEMIDQLGEKPRNLRYYNNTGLKSKKEVGAWFIDTASKARETSQGYLVRNYSSCQRIANYGDDA